MTITCRPLVPQPREYVVGNTVEVRARIEDTDGEVVDPTSLRLLTLEPGGSVSTLVTATETDIDAGTATFHFTPDAPGIWLYRVETSTGPFFAAEERTLVAVARTVPAPP